MAPDDAPGSLTGVGIVLPSLHAVHTSRCAPRHGLQEANAASREICSSDWPSHLQIVEGDHIQVCSQTVFERAAVVKAVQTSMTARLLLHEELDPKSARLGCGHEVQNLAPVLWPAPRLRPRTGERSCVT